MRLTRADILILLAATAFFTYFGVLVHCDLWRPEPEGLAYRFVGPRMIVTGVETGSVAERAGIAAGDEISAWNRQPIDSRLDWAAVEANYEIGRPMTFSLVRGDARLDVELSLGRESTRYWRTQAGVSLLIVRAVQLVTLVFAVVIAFARRGDAAALSGAWLLAAAGVFCVVLPYRIAAVWRDLPAAFGWMLWAPYLSSLSAAAVLFSFFQLFPRRTIRSQWVWGVVWAPMAFAVAPHLSHAWRMVYRPEAMTAAPDVMVAIVAVSLGYIATTVALSIRAWRRLEDLTERRRMKVLVFGSTIACVTAGPLVMAYWGTSREPVLFASGIFAAGTFLLLAVPVSFAYAILRHRLFDLRLIVRLGVQYALARGVLRAIVPAAAVVFVADLFAHRVRPIGEVLAARGWAYAGLAALAVYAEARRHRWLESLDRRFFRERYDARVLLRQVVDDLRQDAGVDQVGPRTVGRIEAALHPEHVSLLVRPAGGSRFSAVASCPGNVWVPGELPNGTLVALVRAVGAPVELAGRGADWILGQVPADELALLTGARVELVVPVALGADGTESVLALGPKRSEEPYTREDLDLLAAIAGSLALALGRSVTSVPASSGDGEECPRCGACYDGGTLVCPVDREPLLALRIPRLLNGRYRLDRRLASGGMGTVYAAADTALDRSVAVKVIRDDLVRAPGAIDRFHREARVAAGFMHPHVVTVHDFGVASGTLAFLVMELLSGTTVRALIERLGWIPPARALAILDDVALAVDAAHRRQIIHRDLKPENVMLVGEDRGEVAKVLDFGVAKLMASGAATTQPTAFGGLVGTPLYMAPEQLRGEEASPAWDLWALAVMAHEMVTGRHPFAGFPVGGSLAWAPEAVESGRDGWRSDEAWRAWLACALAADPRRRPASGRELVSGLRAVAAGSPGGA